MDTGPMNRAIRRKDTSNTRQLPHRPPGACRAARKGSHTINHAAHPFPAYQTSNRHRLDALVLQRVGSSEPAGGYPAAHSGSGPAR